MNRKLRTTVASLGLVATALVGTGVANAQTSSSTSASTSTTNTRPARPAGMQGQQGQQGQPGGGFGAHAATIAKLLGVSTTDLQTAMKTQSIAQIAASKGVNVQTVIDAYVAEEKAEHPDMAAADIVSRVTNMVNNVRPAPPAGAPQGNRPPRGQNGTAPGSTSGTSGSGTSTAKATVKA